MVPKGASMMDARRALPPLWQKSVVDQKKKLLEIREIIDDFRSWCRETRHDMIVSCVSCRGGEKEWVSSKDRWRTMDQRFTFHTQLP
jgi:hypothetical protein